MVNYLLPYMILILYASMAGVDPNLTVAAKSLGATVWQAFRRVFLPVTKGALVAGTLLVFVLALGFFLTPAVLGGAKNTTIAVFIQQRINLFDWGAAVRDGDPAARRHHHRLHHRGPRVGCRRADGSHPRQPEGCLTG